MKRLIIYSHYTEKSFSKAIVDTIVKHTQSKEEEVNFIDLHKDRFNPVFSFSDAYDSQVVPSDKDLIQHYQTLVENAEVINLVYPLWWGGMPAMLKGFFDRVFTKGFAFDYMQDNLVPLLADKEVQVVVTTGADSAHYSILGMHKALQIVQEEGIFSFCGIKAKFKFLGGIDSSTFFERQNYLEELKEFITT